MCNLTWYAHTHDHNSDMPQVTSWVARWSESTCRNVHSLFSPRSGSKVVRLVLGIVGIGIGIGIGIGLPLSYSNSLLVTSSLPGIFMQCCVIRSNLPILPTLHSQCHSRHSHCQCATSTLAQDILQNSHFLESTIQPSIHPTIIHPTIQPHTPTMLTVKQTEVGASDFNCLFCGSRVGQQWQPRRDINQEICWVLLQQVLDHLEGRVISLWFQAQGSFSWRSPPHDRKN